MDVRGHVAVVTGGASGLGLATAERLTEMGAKVAVLDLPGERLDTVARRLPVMAITCDVSSATSAERAMEMVTGELGSLRILVNCAGIAPVTRIIGKEGPVPLDDFARVVSINLIGTFNLMRLAAPLMKGMEPVNPDGERGVIINTASIAAYEGQMGQAAYAASKGGVAAMTLPAARELARHGIRVSAIAPGVFGTPMMLNMPEEVQAAVVSGIPFPKRFGAPDEYARLVAHIIDNPLMNGAVTRLDAALRMNA